MTLRAFFNKYSRQQSIIMILSVFFFIKAQAQSNPDYKIPYEIKFANITFQLNDVSRYLMNQEIANIKANKELQAKNIKKLSLILPIIDPMLKKNDIPLDFRMLSLYGKYQSSISTTTVLDYNVWWCLDEKKAADVDLTINKDIDERKHLVAATQGALNGIKRSQALYGNWASTLFAQLASRSVINTLELPKRWRGTFVVLDAPAYNSLIQFLAFKFVMEHDFSSSMNLQPTVIYEYPYGEGRSLNLIAADLKIEPLSLLATNPWLKANKVPEGDDKVLVEVPSSQLHETKILSEYSRNVKLTDEELGFPILKDAQRLAKGKGGVFYMINGKKGIQADMCDSYVTLAYKGDISIKKFLAYNDMTEKDVCNVGQVYYLEEKDNKAEVPFHVAKNNETFWDIAHQYGVKLKKLLEYNLEDKVVRLEEGRMMWLQTSRPSDRPIEIVEPKEVPVEKIISELVENSPSTASSTSADEPTELSRAYADSVFMHRMSVSEISNKDEIRVAKPNVKVENTVAAAAAENTNTNASLSIENAEVLHEVKKGETLFAISTNYGVSIEQLYALNEIHKGKLVPGEKIKVKSY